MTTQLKRTVVFIIFALYLFLALFTPVHSNSFQPSAVGNQTIIDVEVPAQWIPLDSETSQVREVLSPLSTSPILEHAKIDLDPNSPTFLQHRISLAGIPLGNPNVNNDFEATQHLYFSDKFFKVTAKGIVSNLVKMVEYGETVLTDNIHGTNLLPFIPSEVLKLFIATEDFSLSSANFLTNELTIQRPQSKIELINIIQNNLVSLNVTDLTTFEKVSIDGNDFDYKQLFLYSYQKGNYISYDNNLNLLEEFDISNLELGDYEVVIPIYWNQEQKFSSSSRNQVTITDSVHFTLHIEERDGAPVIVHILDQENNTLIEPFVLTGKLNDKWQVTPPIIDGYNLIKTDIIHTGLLTENQQVVTLIYEKIITDQDDMIDNESPNEEDDEDNKLEEQSEKAKKTEDIERLPEAGTRNIAEKIVSILLVMTGMYLVIKNKK